MSNPPVTRRNPILRTAVSTGVGLLSLIFVAIVGVVVGPPIASQHIASGVPVARAADLAAPSGNPTLVGSYAFNGSQPNMSDVTYHPWQYATVYNGSNLTVTDQTWANYGIGNGGPYQGWDALLLPNSSVFRTNTDPNWLHVKLTRGATVAIVWRSNASSLPAWLSGWTLSSNPAPDWFCGGGSTQCPVYTKTFAGPQTIALGGVAASGDPFPRDVYYVLFAEQSGQPALQPVQLGGPPAYANQTCPDWLHNLYVTTGPDGKQYPTWHPQIDPTYWCYFRHEHGSDPSLFSPTYRPAYGYTAAAMGENEPHPGFKTYVFDDGQNRRWAITHHFGTASMNRACARHHTVDLAVETVSTQELLADLHLMADFGASVANATGEALTPPACPNQAAAPTRDGSTGVREMAVVTRNAVMYEPWRFDARNNVLGITGTLTFNTPDAVSICNDVVCSQGITTGNSGSYRHFESNRDFGITAGANTDVFYTDPHGVTVTSQLQPGAVRQFVKAGLSVSPPYLGDNADCYTTDYWRASYRCTPPPLAGFPTNLEGALQAPN